MYIQQLCYFCDGIGSVFDSQVLSLLKAINEKKIFNKIYLFLGIRNEQVKQELYARKLTEEIEVIFFKSYPNYPMFNYFIQREIANALKIKKIKPQECIFHTRGEILAYHLSKIIEKENHRNILPDIRGTTIEEVNEFSELNFFLKTLKVYNYKNAFLSLHKFEKISVVSRFLGNYLNEKFNLKSEKIVIIPCLAGKNFIFDETQRKQIRNELKLNETDNLIVFASAGTALWQKFDIIKDLADKGIKVLNLSRRDIQHKNIINKFVEYESVPKYLNASDIGIIWRDNKISNLVASPVKFSEYICSGLPVIANDSVKMIVDYLKDHSYGGLLSNLKELNIEKIQELRSLNRQKISANGQKWLGIDTVTNQYIRVYELFH